MPMKEQRIFSAITFSHSVHISEEMFPSPGFPLEVVRSPLKILNLPLFFLRCRALFSYICGSKLPQVGFAKFRWISRKRFTLEGVENLYSFQKFPLPLPPTQATNRGYQTHRRPCAAITIPQRCE